MDYRIDLEEQPGQADIHALSRGLAAFNRQTAGDEGYRPLAMFLRDEDGVMVGGISGSTYWNWFTIDLFWIDERARGKGYGSRMLAAAEQEAVRRGCLRACLDTHTFQAPAFYEERGYEVYGVLPDFPLGHSRICMVKRLIGEP